LLAGPAGSHAGISQKFLQTNHKDLRFAIADWRRKNHPSRRPPPLANRQS